MPLSPKGSKVLAAMKSEYGAKKGTGVFYASINAGRLKGAEGARRPAKALKGKG